MPPVVGRPPIAFDVTLYVVPYEPPVIPEISSRAVMLEAPDMPVDAEPITNSFKEALKKPWVIALARSADSAKEARLRFFAVVRLRARLLVRVFLAAMRHPSKCDNIKEGVLHFRCDQNRFEVNPAPVCRSSVLPS